MSKQRFTDLQRRIFAELDKGRTDCERIAEELDAHRSTVFQTRRKWERQRAQELLEAEARDSFTFGELVLRHHWRFRDRALVGALMLARILDEHMFGGDAGDLTNPTYLEADERWRAQNPDRGEPKFDAEGFPSSYRAISPDTRWASRQFTVDYEPDEPPPDYVDLGAEHRVGASRFAALLEDMIWRGVGPDEWLELLAAAHVLFPDRIGPLPDDLALYVSPYLEVRNKQPGDEAHHAS